jgi:putative endonuclease
MVDQAVPRRLTKVTLQALDWLIARTGRAEVNAEHRQTGRRGEIDMAAWDGDVLCFVELKTRTTRDVKPAHVAVDREKQRELIGMAREYLHHVRGNPPWLVDTVSVYFEVSDIQPQIELFKNAFPVS